MSSEETSIATRVEAIATSHKKLLLAPGITVSNKKLLGPPGIATRSKKLLYRGRY